MTRLAIVIIAATLLGLAALSVAHAQPAAQLSPPSQLSPPAQLPRGGTGSISGRIVLVGPSILEDLWVVRIIPADTPEPIEFFPIARHIAVDEDSLDAEGNFTVTGLADGDYFILPLFLNRIVERVTPPLNETVSFALDSGPLAEVSVLRVTVADGQAVTGIEIVAAVRDFSQCVDFHDTQPLSLPNGVSPPNDLPFICPPTTGAGPGGANGATGRIAAAGLAVAALLLLAGGVALRVRGSRRA